VEQAPKTDELSKQSSPTGVPRLETARVRRRDWLARLINGSRLRIIRWKSVKIRKCRVVLFDPLTKSHKCSSPIEAAFLKYIDAIAEVLIEFRPRNDAAKLDKRIAHRNKYLILIEPDILFVWDQTCLGTKVSEAFEILVYLIATDPCMAAKFLPADRLPAELFGDLLSFG
jgi:hypothetical protein